MLDWLLTSDYDALTKTALWSIVTVVITTIVLFVYTLGLRLATITELRRRREFLRTWRDVFANAVLNQAANDPDTIPRLRRADRTDLLEEWNRARSMVDGEAVDRLIKLAKSAGIPKLALRLFRSRRIKARILGVQSIGHLRLKNHWDDVRALVDDDNIALSMTAAEALVEINPSAGIELIVPMINQRRDWPRTRVSVVLRQSGSERISEPLYRAIRGEDDAGKTYLLQFARLMESEIRDELVRELLSSSHDPGVLNAALKLVSGYADVPRIAELTQHEAWFVRMRAAIVLGDIGQQDHIPLLEKLLADKEWWVRYRAAQAMTHLPFLGPNDLRQMQQRQADPFAADILQQSFAEAGLA